MPSIENQPGTTNLPIAGKILTWVLIALSIITALSLVYIIFSKEGSDNTLQKYIETEIKNMKAQVDSANNKFVILTVQSDSLKSDILKIKSDRQVLINKINDQNNQLATIKNKYETISHYDNIAADSLRRIFAERFNH